MGVCVKYSACDGNIMEKIKRLRIFRSPYLIPRSPSPFPRRGEVDGGDSHSLRSGGDPPRARGGGGGKKMRGFIFFFLNFRRITLWGFFFKGKRGGIRGGD